MADAEGVDVRTTGGQVDEIVMALIDAAYDKDVGVRSVMVTSLKELGRHQPALVLSSCHAYLGMHVKLAQGHRIIILESMQHIIHETVSQLDQELARSIIKQASAELTHSKEVLPEWQEAASGVLVALGGNFCHEVMEELQAKFQPGILPHFFVVQTMANLATTNVYGMVPFLKVVLGTMLPMLALAKQDNMRWVFSFALCKFCEAILDYVANIEKAPDPSVKKEFFSSEIDSAYDILFNNWLQSKELKLRVVLVEALGQMAHIVSPEKLEAEVGRLLQAVLGLYRRHPTDPYHVTQGLGLVLAAATTAGPGLLEPQLEQLLSALFPQMCQPVDYGNPVTVKNHNEVLRCYTVLAGPFSDRLVPHLLQKLEGGNERTRIATAAILRHLINSADDRLEDKKPLVLAGLRQLLADSSNKVKKEVAQTVMAMSHHGYLELEGGQTMVEFVVRQCCLAPDNQTKRPADPDYVSNEALRSMCENVLQLMSTTVDNMETVLWPYLLEFLTPPQYAEGVGVVCRCIANVTQPKHGAEGPPLKINYDEKANVPKPPELIARLIVAGGRPVGGRQRGLHALHALRGLAPVLGDGLADVWDKHLPALEKYFDDSAEDSDTWSQNHWEDLVLKLVADMAEQMGSEEWTAALGEALGHQLALYASCPHEKGFAIKALGLVMSKSTKKDFINKHLDLILASVKHSVDLEREGCAIAMGHAATTHLDPVLVKLEAAARNDGGKRSSGILGFIKDMSRSEVDDKTKATLILCYGHVTLRAQPSIVTSRLETTILKALLPHYPHVKKNRDLSKLGQLDLGVKHSLIETTEMIGRAMHPEHLMMHHEFKERNELLTHMQTYLRLESPTSIVTDTRALALNACATLVKLDPYLPETETAELLKAALDSVLPLPPEGSTQPRGKEETYEDALHKETLVRDALSALEHLLSQLLLKRSTPDGLEDIFRHLHAWTLTPNEHERERALHLSKKVFALYLANMQVSIGTSSHFSNLGRLVGRLVPRCADPDPSVRCLAINCIQLVLQIALRYQGHGEDYRDPAVQEMTGLQDKVKKNDPDTLFSVSKEIAKTTGRLLPGDQLLPLVEQLYEGLTDPIPQSSSGASVVLNSIIKSRGGAVPNEVEPMLAALQSRLSLINCPQTYTGTLHAVRTLASHHLLSVMTALLHYPLPFNEHVLACWRVIGEDRTLTASVLSHLLDVLSRSLPYEERPGLRDRDPVIRTATPLPVAATCALCELFAVPAAADQYADRLPTLLGALMVRVASTVGVRPPKITKVNKDDKTKDKSKDKKSRSPSTLSKAGDLDPCREAVEALLALLTATGGSVLVECLRDEDAVSRFQDEQLYPEAFTLLVRLIVELQPQHVCKLINVLNPTLASVYEPQRVMTAAVFAELINQKCAGDLALVEMLVNGLLGRLVDPSHIVRRLCIRGLGNVASVGREQVQRHSTTVLSAMMAGMDDKDDFDDLITLEAMSGLSRILAQIDESHIRAILINIALRIRPCFEKDKPAVRAAAFTLFGDLSRFGDGPSKAPFLEQIHTNFVTLLLHLHDPEPDVRKACKYALRLLGPLIESSTINTMFQRHLPEHATLHYGEFMNDLSKAIIHDFADKLNFYIMGNVTFFRSSWSEIKSNAAMFVGFLLGNAPPESYADISKEHVCSALIMLLKDMSPEVRVKAAEAMSRLHGF